MATGKVPASGHRRLPAGTAAAVLIATLHLHGPADAEAIHSAKVRLQVRADLGDFAASGDSEYRTGSDFYLRRSRLEITGRPRENVSFQLVLAGDRLGQRESSGRASLPYAFVNYRFGDAASIRAGQLKLPMIRQRWVSASRQLFIDRSLPALALGNAVGGYLAPQVSLHGKLRGGTLAYLLSLSDGLEAGDSDSRFSGAAVDQADGPALVGRLELSPAGWLEGKKRESHLGTGRHFALALNAAREGGIEIGGTREDRLLVGGDLSYHHGGLGIQAEYLRLYRSGGGDASPAGWYLQSGYYLSGRQLEPAIRIARYDADLPAGGDAITTCTGGLNWYADGHRLKLMLNLVHERFGPNVRELFGEPARTSAQLMNQVYF